MQRIWTIAFDADDTLWHNEVGFRNTQTRFAQLLSDWTEPDDLKKRLLAAERRNLAIYGFGVKGFVLSMVETAIEVSHQEVPASIIDELLSMGREMLAAPVELLNGAQQVIEALKPIAEILLITKGDLLDQERKLTQSGLESLFDHIEIVSDKTAPVYSRIFARHDTPHQMMVGNSLKSDVIPALQAGLWGVHIEHKLTWEYEKAPIPTEHQHFRQISALVDLPDLVTSLSESGHYTAI